MIQNTKEWLKWRHTGIGASESPVIMGVSRFKTPLELWEQKINPTLPKNNANKYVTEKGHELERVARNRYELETFMEWKPVLAEYSENKRIRASLDGFNESLNAVWECKYMGLEKYNVLKNNELSKRERIPTEYWPQLMHQILVTNASEVHFTGIVDHKVLKTLKHGETEQCTFVFKVDNECTDYIRNELYPAIIKFIDCIDNKISPDKNSKDEISVKDMELKKLLTKYKNIKEKAEKYNKEEKEIKKKIFEISLKHHNKVICGNYKITESISKDKEIPDYSKYLQEKNIDDEFLINSGYSKTQKGRKTQRITELER